MKAQNNSKLTKKTVFVYKTVKDQTIFYTDPSMVTVKTIFTSMNCK